MSHSREDLRRIVAQHLQSLERAGLTHWRRLHFPKPQPITPPARPTAARPTTAAQVQPEPVLAPKPAPMAAKTAIPTVHQPLPVLKLSREERIQRLAEVAKCVAGCQRCPELASARTQTVFGVGNPEARILFIGEAPGADEDAQGEPFVGRAGQLLNDIVKACRLQREEIYICNILRCRPPGNRTPSQVEADHCREYLDQQIQIVSPEYIVCWGSTAAKNLLASELTIGKMRQQWFKYGEAKVICTYHPSYLLRNPAAKKDVWEDMKFLFRGMGIELAK